MQPRASVRRHRGRRASGVLTDEHRPPRRPSRVGRTRSRPCGRLRLEVRRPCRCGESHRCVPPASGSVRPLTERRCRRWPRARSPASRGRSPRTLTRRPRCPRSGVRLQVVVQLDVEGAHRHREHLVGPDREDHVHHLLRVELGRQRVVGLPRRCGRRPRARRPPTAAPARAAPTPERRARRGPARSPRALRPATPAW